MKKESVLNLRIPTHFTPQLAARKENREGRSGLTTLLALLALLVSAPSATAQISGAEYNLKLDFGAVGDGKTDDSPALQAALDAMAQAGGGTLLVPPGRYALATPVREVFSNKASAITIRGVDSASQFLIKSGLATQNIRFDDLGRLVLSHLTFVGSPGERNDATVTIFISYCSQATIEYCSFYGISTVDWSVGAVVYAHNTDLRVQNSAFLGCTGNSTNGSSVVVSDQWMGLTITDTDFFDWGMLNGTYHSKTGISSPYAWVSVKTPTRLSDATSQNVVQLRGVRMDEGALFGFACNPSSDGPRVAQVLLSGLRINVSSMGGAAGVFIMRANQVDIDHSWMGFNAYSRSAIRVEDAGNVMLNSVLAANGTRGSLSLEADALTHIIIIASSFDTIQTAPEQTVIVRRWADILRMASGTEAINTSRTQR